MTDADLDGARRGLAQLYRCREEVEARNASLRGRLAAGGPAPPWARRLLAAGEEYLAAADALLPALRAELGAPGGPPPAGDPAVRPLLRRLADATAALAAAAKGE